MDFSIKRRRDREKLASQTILKICSSIDDAEHIHDLKYVANDLVMFMDTIKEYLLQSVLKINLNDIMECNYHQPPEDEDMTTAVKILKSCTRIKYQHIMDSFTKRFNFSKASIPSV